jgi:hypothetical protein
MKHAVVVLTMIAFCTFGFAKNECPQTTTYRIYSNAFYSKETGDVGGYELALKPTTGNSYDALLYIYEGAPNTDGIAMTGTGQAPTISLEGNWIEELIEYPSKRHVTDTKHVKLKGRFSKAKFSGLVQIDNDSSPFSLKSTNHIWLCKALND